MKPQLYATVFLLINFVCQAQDATPLFVRQPESIRADLYAGLQKEIKQGDFYRIDEARLNDIVAQQPEMLTLDISENNTVFTLVLSKNRITAPGYSVKNAAGTVMKPTRAAHYSGYVSGDPHSKAAFSFSNESVMGVVLNDRGNFVFGKVRNTDGDVYVFYNDRNMLMKNPFGCGTSDARLPAGQTPNRNSRSGRSSGCSKKVRIYLEADYTTYQDMVTFSATETFMTSIFNITKAIYAADGMQLELSELKIWDTPNNYDVTDIYSGLQSFSDYIQQPFNGDLAHLFSTYAAQGGVASLAGLCGGFPYSFSDAPPYFNNLPAYSWSINIITHELGHSLASNHTHHCGWELSPGVFGAIDSCVEVEDDFGNLCYGGPDIPRVGTIMSYCHTTSKGTNLNLGFGPIPSQWMRDYIEYSTCLSEGSSTVSPVATNNGPYCLGDTVFLNVSNFSTGTVAWDGPNGFIASGSTPFIVVDNVNKRGIYRATVTDTCTSSDTTYVEVLNPPPVSAINFFNGQILQPVLMGTGYLYQWYLNDTMIAGATAVSLNANSPGQYKVEISNAAGCKTMSLTYTIVVSGLGELEGMPGKIYKSVSGNEIIVELYEKPCRGNIVFQLCDVAGRVVSAESLDCSYRHTIAIQNLSAGLYFARILESGKLKMSDKIFKN